MERLKEAIKDFLLHCRYEKSLSTHTLKAYELDLKQFSRFVSDGAGGNELAEDVGKIDKKVLRDYLQQLQSRNKVKTVKRKIATLKALFNYLEFEDRILSNPFRKMRIKIREPLTLPGILTLEEIKMIFRTVYREKHLCSDRTSYAYKTVVRDIVVLELLFATGIRVSELCNLKTVNVNIRQKYVLVKGKGRKERVVQVCSEEIIDILQEYSELFHSSFYPGEYFLVNRLGHRLSEQSVRFMVKKYAEICNIEKVLTPHMFRHTFATLLLEEGVDIRYIQQLLGHSTITTTQIYTHVTKNKQKEILTNLHPRGSFRAFG